MTDKQKVLTAHDAWLDAMPPDDYDLCPCGCGKKFRFVVRDPKICAEHEAKFVKDFIDKSAPKA